MGSREVLPLTIIIAESRTSEQQLSSAHLGFGCIMAAAYNTCYN